MTHRETFGAITELTGAALTIKGYHYEKGQPIPEGERKLYLLIEGPTELTVKRAKVRWSCQSCFCNRQAPKPVHPAQRMVDYKLVSPVSCHHPVLPVLRRLPLPAHQQQSELSCGCRRSASASWRSTQRR
jgi:hypothetical protein